MAKTRTARTQRGTEVEINTTWKVEGGYYGYAVHARGYAVLVFIPGE